MINATVGTNTNRCRAYRIGELHIVELPGSALHGRHWTIFRDLDTVGVRVGLSEQDRRQALAQALTAMVAGAPAAA